MVQAFPTSDNFVSFNLAEDTLPKQEFTEKKRPPNWALPALSTQEAWANYSDDLVYEVDKRIREWMACMKPVWSRGGRDRRFTFSTLLDILGLEVEVRKSNNYMKVARVFAYYSSKINKQTTINGVKHKNVYTIAPSRLNRAPYSLRLRIEEATEPLNGRSLQLPNDNLTVGHARHPRTDENMKRRSDEAKRRYNEYKRKRSEQAASEAGTE